MTAGAVQAAPAVTPTDSKLGMERRALPGAVLVSAATAASGLLTYAFLVLAARSLGPDAYGRIGILWGAMFIGAIVLFRPLEQTASRTISDRLARGGGASDVVRSVAISALSLVGVVVVAGLVAWPLVQRRLFDGSRLMTAMLLVGIGLYGMSYVVRGVVGGVRWFGGYALVLLADGGARLLIALPLLVVSSLSLAAVAVVAAGAAGLLAPLLVGRRHLAPALQSGGVNIFGLRAAGSFALPAAVVAACDQLVVNGPPLLVAIDGASARTVGIVFAATMLLRAPVYVFQGLAASLLPNFTHLRVRGHKTHLPRTLLRLGGSLAGMGVVIVVGTALFGSVIMRIFYGTQFSAPRSALVFLAIAVACYLVAATASQALFALGRVWAAAAAWILISAVFIGIFVLLPGAEVERVSAALAAAMGVGAIALGAALAAVLAR